jgi:hypothetical protein
MMNKIRKTKKRTFAIEVATLETSRKPNIDAMIAIIRKMTAHVNIVYLWLFLFTGAQEGASPDNDEDDPANCTEF